MGQAFTNPAAGYVGGRIIDTYATGTDLAASSTLDSINERIAKLHTLASQLGAELSGIADRTFGGLPRPAAIGNGSPKAPSVSKLDEMRNVLNALEHAIEDIANEVGRFRTL